MIKRSASAHIQDQQKIQYKQTESKTTYLIECVDIMRVGGDDGVNSEEKMISSDNNSNNGIKGSKEI